MSQQRSIVYVDAFNLYHRCLKPLRFQWLNLWAFFLRLRKDDDLLRVCYFTAELEGRRLPAQRAYHAALASTPQVEVIYGKFPTQQIDCEVTACSHAAARQFFYTKEKRTDVNIALRMVTDALRDACDLLILVSGDSDLVPAVRQVREQGKRVFVDVPAQHEHEIGANELRQTAEMHKNLPLRTLDRAQFPEMIPTDSGPVKKDLDW